MCACMCIYKLYVTGTLPNAFSSHLKAETSAYFGLSGLAIKSLNISLATDFCTSLQKGVWKQNESMSAMVKLDPEIKAK